MDTLINSTVAALTTALITEITENSAEPFTQNTTMTSSTSMTNITTQSTSMSTHFVSNGTTMTVPVTTGAPDTPPGYVGFLTAGLAILLYGTNFAPVKKFETGDGMFFQWVLCLAIWITGLVVQLIRHSPEFYPICMLGGVLWETGNICVVPIVKTIGLGLGMCVWGMTNLLSGWATGRFGLFGVDKETLSNYTMNDIGVCLAVLSAVIFSMVKNNLDGSQEGDIEIVVSEQTPLISETSINREKSGSVLGDEEEEQSFIDKLSPTSKRIVGLLLSLASGVMYGQLFTPAKHLQDHGHSSNGLDYVFSTFCGILLSSTFYFLVYAAFKQNKPKIYPNVIIPGFISGIMWGVATSSWFVANKVLSNSVAFPIVTTGPAVVASILGVLVFKEISGKRNILVLMLGMAVTITGSILSGLSF